jgi:hypothetical protein
MIENGEKTNIDIEALINYSNKTNKLVVIIGFIILAGIITYPYW